MDKRFILFEKAFVYKFGQTPLEKCGKSGENQA